MVMKPPPVMVGGFLLIYDFSVLKLNMNIYEGNCIIIQCKYSLERNVVRIWINAN